MENQTFEKIWKEIILSESLVIVGRLPALCLIKDQDAYKRDLFRAYNEERASAKSFMSFKSGSLEKRIDHHKIAAAFYLALVKKPFLIVANEERELKKMGDWNYLANHYLAWRTALGILLSFMVHKEYQNDSLSNYGVYLRQHGLQIPKCEPNVACCHEDTYEVEMLKGLYLAFKVNQLNVFLLSNLFYLFEFNTLNVYNSVRAGEGKTADDK